MTTLGDPRLDDFERRLHELESELVELRLALANGVGDAVEPVEPLDEGGVPAWAQQWIDRGDLRGLLNALEYSRRQALREDDLAELGELLRVAELVAPGWESEGLAGRALRLTEALHQNVRFLERKLGVVLDVAPGLAPEPAETPEEVPAGVEPEQYDWDEEQPVVPARPAWSAPSFQLPELSAADLLGAKALAIAGGIVTLLGIVFFFVLAVNRGWVGPEGRIGLGAFAALVVYAGGLELRRRFGETYSSLAAVAAGIAGGYGVLLAAAQLYHFVGHAAALAVAAGIAGIGLATALRWRSQMIAGLGLLGATLAPLAVAVQDGISVLGTAFVAFMAVATVIVAIRERWDPLLVLGALASLPQALALAMQAQNRGESPGRVVALAAIFSGITVGTGIARHFRAERHDLGGLPTSFLFAGATFAVGCALRLYGSSESRGYALLAVAISFGLLAAAFFPRRRERDLSALVGAIGLIVGGIAFGELMSGSPLAFAWAGEAAMLAWLARRVKEIRYQLFALVYLVAAVIHVLAADVPPIHLFKPLETSAGGALAVVAVGLAAAVFGFSTAPRRLSFEARGGLFGVLAPIYDELAARQRLLREAAYWLSGLAAVYALSFGVLAAVSSFGWGHAAMYAVWSVIGLALFATGLRRKTGKLRAGGLVWLGATVVAAIANGERALSADPRAAACLVAGVALLAASLVELFFLLAPQWEKLVEDERISRLAASWLGVGGAVAALSVGVLAAVPSYGWGHFAMYALWSGLGLGVVVAALRRQAEQIRAGGLVGLGVTVVAAFANGEKAIAPDPRAATFFVVGAALMTAALADQLLPRRRELTPVALLLVLGSVGLGLGAFTALLGGAVGSVDERGLGFLGLATLYGALAAALFRREGQRDLSTLLWGTALVLGYGSSVRLLPGTYHVLALSLAAAALAWLSTRAREPRFLGAAAVSVLVAAATVLFSVAPPGHLFRPHEHPGHGALGALFVALAAAFAASIADETTEVRRRGRSVGFWVAGVPAVYGLSLFILALFQGSFAGSVDTNFHRGHTAVSAFWGLIGLVLLYVGLTRLRALRVAGFAMFTVSLLKIFLFDLPSLSSITRALSFLAVGAVLLLGGFFYQRLATAQPPPPKRHREPVEWPRGLMRPELVLALAAAAVLIVWFGSGLAPLGKSSASAGTVRRSSTSTETIPVKSAPVKSDPARSIPGKSISSRAVVDHFRKETGLVLVRDANYSDSSWDVLDFAKDAPAAETDKYGVFSIYVVKSDLAIARSTLLTGTAGKPIEPDANGVYWTRVSATRQFGRNVFLFSVGIFDRTNPAWKRLNAILSGVARPVTSPQ